MTNPFSGIITPAFKQLFDNAISSLLYNDALTLPCTIYYGVTKYESCDNCVYDPIGNKSANRYQSGGFMPFPFGSICPMCNGIGKHPIETSISLNLMVIWNTKQFMNHNTVNVPEGTIQTITFLENAHKLKKAKEIIVASDIPSVGRFRYERTTEPQPCGLGDSTFIECLWKKSG